MTDGKRIRIDLGQDHIAIVPTSLTVTCIWRGDSLLGIPKCPRNGAG